MKRFAILAIVALAFTACRQTRYVPVETVHTEHRDNIVERVTVDSVTDTRFVYIKGDTVIDYRDRVRWRDRLVHDSIYMERTDSVAVPYPVEKPLTKWQQTKMDLGGIAIALFIITVSLWLLFLYLKRKR